MRTFLKIESEFSVKAWPKDSSKLTITKQFTDQPKVESY